MIKLKPLVMLSLLSDKSLWYYISIILVSITIILTLPIMAVFALGSDTVNFLSGSSSLDAAKAQGFYTGGSVPGDSYAWGNCTYWAYAIRYFAGDPIPTTWGNANTWDERAVADGYIVDHTPQVGAIMQSDAGEYGHVAYVIQVASDGTWTISEMNAPHLNVVSQRQFRLEAAINYDFIHERKT